MRLVVTLVVAVAIACYVGLKALRSDGEKTAGAVTSAIAHGSDAVAETNLRGAATALEGFHTANGTYAGAAVAGVALVRADASGYCIQTSPPASVEHLAGPGGMPQPGPC